MSQYIVGLTGGIGSGKTTVSNIFQSLGITIIDADIVAREVVAPSTYALQKIQTKFGNDILLADGSLNRTKLRTIVFSNEQDKLWLNELLHPIIRKEMLAQLRQALSPYSILVAPLLIENKLTSLVNRVLVVDVTEQTQIQRTLLRDNSNAQEIRNIIASQATREQRLAVADDVIDNNSSNIELLTTQITQLHQQYLSLARNN